MPPTCLIFSSAVNAPRSFCGSLVPPNAGILPAPSALLAIGPFAEAIGDRCPGPALIRRRAGLGAGALAGAAGVAGFDCCIAFATAPWTIDLERVPALHTRVG